MQDKLIFVTNDDGIQALGIQTLARLMSQLGEVVVVAPDAPRSGAGCSITPTRPVELTEWVPEMPASLLALLPPVGEYPIHYYTCSGTPVDCVKIASEHVLPCTPDLMVSGINHGDNASCSLHYSGTMGAVFEGTLKRWSAIGYSLRTYQARPDLSPYYDTILRVAQHVLDNGLPLYECLNVNFPEVEVLQGARVVPLAQGEWNCEWADASNPHAKRAFWLTGHFTNLEPENPHTDYAALDQGYASITPIQLDMTAYHTMQSLKVLEQ